VKLEKNGPAKGRFFLPFFVLQEVIDHGRSGISTPFGRGLKSGLPMAEKKPEPFVHYRGRHFG
jgi:hypothetical protein